MTFLRAVGSVGLLALLACRVTVDEPDSVASGATRPDAISVCPTTVFPSGVSLRHDGFEEDAAYRAAETGFLAELDAACASAGIDRKTCTEDVVGESATGFEGACLALCSRRKELSAPTNPVRHTTDAQKVALLMYTDHSFGALGRALWSAWDWDPTNRNAPPRAARVPIDAAREALARQQSFAFMLKGALARIEPPSPIEEGRVFRGDFWGREGDPELLAQAEARFREKIPEPGDLYTVPGFFSTTLDAQTHFLRAPLVYRIKTKAATKGRPVDVISSRPDEREVLFPPCTTFRVTGKVVLENAPVQGKRPLVVGGEEVKFDRQLVVTLEEQ